MGRKHMRRSAIRNMMLYWWYSLSRYHGWLQDVQMPVMSGFEATALIRKHEMEHGTPRPVPIIALTAHAMIGYRVPFTSIQRLQIGKMFGSRYERVLDQTTGQETAPFDGPQMRDHSSRSAPQSHQNHRPNPRLRTRKSPGQHAIRQFLAKPASLQQSTKHSWKRTRSNATTGTWPPSRGRVTASIKSWQSI